MSKESKILFLVPDGVGIRNFLYSKVLHYLKDKAEIIIWSPLPKTAFTHVEELHNISISSKSISLDSESFFCRFFRESTTYARLIINSKKQNNKTILLNWRRPKNNKKLFILYVFAELFGRLISYNYKLVLFFEKIGIKSWSKKTIEKHKRNLVELSPSSIFITHQRVAGLMPICLAANQLNIKTSTAIYSWDNLPKARLCVKADFYLVWSAWMKQEMKDYYSEIEESKVLCVGTPQFEFYSQDEKIVDRQTFATTYNLDNNKKWICYSGDDITTSPHDSVFLRDVANAINEIEDDVQIIFRRCPVDFSIRYDDVLNDYKDLIIPIDPIWNNKSANWVGYFSTLEDISLQVNLAHHCNSIINLGSTMAHDFATQNKPCLYLNYDPVIDIVLSTKAIYNFQHFRTMKDLDAVLWINNKEEILDKVLQSLNSPNSVAIDRQKWLEKIVLHPLNTNSINIAKAIL
jgi:hypothetical protein